MAGTFEKFASKAANQITSRNEVTKLAIELGCKKQAEQAFLNKPGDFAAATYDVLEIWKKAQSGKDSVLVDNLWKKFDEAELGNVYETARDAAGFGEYNGKPASQQSVATSGGAGSNPPALAPPGANETAEGSKTPQGEDAGDGDKSSAEPSLFGCGAFKASKYAKGKGKFFIINNEEFISPTKRRTCAGADQKAIDEFLEKLKIKKEDYDILKDQPINKPDEKELLREDNGILVLKKDQTRIKPVRSELERVREELSTNEAGYEYFCCFVMSHGSQKEYRSSARTDTLAKNRKYLADKSKLDAEQDATKQDATKQDATKQDDEPGESVFIDKAEDEMTIEELISFFKADQCPGLAEKPKLFFIDACRGDKYGETFNTNNPGETGGDVNPPAETSRWKTFSIESDMFVFYATPPGYVSYFDRRKGFGSVFIENLCEVLNKNSGTSDIMEITTIVTERVSKRLISYEGKGCKQIPFATTTLTKRFKFE